MSGLVNALVIAAVVALVLARQLRPRVVAGGRWWLLPVVLIALTVRDGGGLIDGQHQDASVALLSAELAVGAAMGVVWATTTRMWRESDGRVMAKGTKATLAVWLLGIAVRGGLYAVAAAASVHQSSSSVMLAVAVTLLIRSGVLLWRAQGLAPSYRAVS
ncbi:hypothetical protein RVR_7814 [Actinacidiphila reveromycinica]|uniref:DUF1453 domain-containing protein n=1 Tax=Actinacidiphila reveromycinica TaxID=659352 RepID=A0A7U3VRG4_9ACTN|nr:DUF1453 family protein [Streptomyces sp. SN-593]BBB00709.1 hypothetical protein RVR_7814 [Streptomyces sp. SN-593]